MKITKPYGTYFQKSKVFAYPLINITKNAPFRPKQTYLSWEELYENGDNRLLCWFEPGEDKEKWRRFRQGVLIRNTYFEKYIEPEDENFCIAIFDLSSLKDTFQKIVTGRYSAIHPDSKSLILKYYTEGTGDHAYIETFLYPEKFTSLYAQLFDVTEELLIKVGELCNKPDLVKEMLHDEIMKSYTLANQTNNTNR